MSHYEGLSQATALQQLEKYGENILPEEKRLSRLGHLWRQFTSPLIYILVAAGSITYILGDYTDAFVIFAAVFINTVLGYYQEVKAENALYALKNILSSTAQVYRRSELKKIPIQYLVPEDIVVLHQGDKIPADGTLLEAISLSINESILTGESEAVTKKEKDSIYMGTIVLTGRAVYKVTKTGLVTKLGSIASKLSTTEDTQTPLQIRLNALATFLAIGVIILAAIVMTVGLLKGIPLPDMFAVSVALAVAAIPEGLTISLTVILALGMQRVLKRRALVRRLVAAEALGSVTVIATDKTGTLTEGNMRVTEVQVNSMNTALDIACFANNLDDPIEFALWDWVSRNGEDPQEKADAHKRQSEIPFDSIRKFMSVTIEKTQYIKGAPEILLSKCNVAKTQQDAILEDLHTWSKKGLRVIAFAIKKPTHTHWTWIGMVAIEDPVRKGLDKVFASCKRAGLRIVMITGDHAGTAEAVWKNINGDDSSDIAVVTGDELEKISDADLRTRIKHVQIFARVSPMQKLRIVQALQQQGEVVALIGDGVNDALALKASNIGVVVGEASDVAKETSDMVLLDSNFKTIVNAIYEGRSIFDNIQKVLLYLLSDSLSQIVIVVGALFIGLPLPLTASQILWINIITDSLPALSLSLEPHTRSTMRKGPRSSDALINGPIGVLGVTISLVMGLGGLVLYWYMLHNGSVELARSMTFTYFACTTLLIIFPVRTLLEPIKNSYFFNNPLLIGSIIVGLLLQVLIVQSPVLNSFVHAVPLLMQEWLLLLFLAFTVICSIEILKAVFRSFKLHLR